MRVSWHNKCKKKQRTPSKSLHLEWMKCTGQYVRYSNGQLRLADFGQPVGINLKEENRWVKRAKLIPWNDIEKRYAALFNNKKGNVAKPLRLALGDCIIQADYGFPDVETALQIQETAYLQYFCGYEGYDDSKLPFDPSLMVYFRKRLTAEVLGEFNKMILVQSKVTPVPEPVETPIEKKNDDQGDTNEPDDHDKPDPPANGGTMIVHATYAPSQIRFPQDTALLNEARENAKAIIDTLHIPTSQKPLTYRKRAHKEMIKRYKARTGRYPERVLADKIYRNRENLSYCAAHNVRLSGPALGRPRKNEVRDKKRDYQDQADWVEVERQFSLAKRKCGLGMIMTRLEETTCHCLAMSVLLLNLRKLQRLLHAIFRWLFGVKKEAFVQILSDINRLSFPVFQHCQKQIAYISPVIYLYNSSSLLLLQWLPRNLFL